jgi:hypothetical protein
MLANPLSMKPRDVKRRECVRQRNIDFNTQFAASDVSTRDYFADRLLIAGNGARLGPPFPAASSAYVVRVVVTFVNT